jgi:hypothetical protein
MSALKPFKVAGALLALSCVMLGTPPALAQSDNTPSENIYWGGVGFSGAWSDRATSYPVTSGLLCLASQPCPKRNLDAAARKFFVKQKFDKFNLKLEKVTGNNVEAKIAVITISSEELGIKEDIQQSKDKFEHTYRVFGNFIVYKADTGKIVRSIPLIIRHGFYLAAPKQLNKLAAELSPIFFDHSLGINFFSALHAKVRGVDMTTEPKKQTQISGFKFSDDAFKQFPGKSRKASEAKFARFLEGQIVSDTNGYLIPTAAGESVVAGKIKATFEEGERELVLPEAAFKLAVNLRLAKKFEFVRGAQKTTCHAVALTFIASDQIETIANINFSNYPASCMVGALDQKYDGGFYFTISTYSLLQQMSRQFGSNGPSEAWLKANAKRNGDKDVGLLIKKIKDVALSPDM